MPQATNLIVKDKAGVNKTFTLLTPAAGYGSPAEWALKEGATAAVWPTATLSAHKTGNRSRRVPVKVRIPASYTSVTTGLPVVSSSMEFNGSVSVPDDFPDDQKDNGVAYIAGVINTALVMACFRDGLPAT